MVNRTKFLILVLMLAHTMAVPALACGDAEAPSACGQDSASDARWMLKRVVTAINADQAEALREFRLGLAGFRTQDTYVFCVGPDGIMTAHPNPILQGQDVRTLHDETGNYFIATMLRTAKPDQVSEIHYLFPRPGGSVATAKTTFYTRAADQVCGVGIYDEDQAAAPAATPDATLAELRQRLTAEMPADLKADWTTFQQALDAASNAKDAAITKIRQDADAADALLRHP